MKFAGYFLAVVSAIGLFAMAAPHAISQQPGYGMSSFSASNAPTYRDRDEALPLEAAMDRFNYALANHDVGMLQAAGVKRSSAKLWQRFFSENPRATVADTCPASDLLISYDTGYWNCIETVTIISEGKPKSFIHVIHFTFARKRGIWLVADRR
jgi:hypothetical protein